MGFGNLQEKLEKRIVSTAQVKKEAFPLSSFRFSNTSSLLLHPVLFYKKKPKCISKYTKIHSVFSFLSFPEKRKQEIVCEAALGTIYAPFFEEIVRMKLGFLSLVIFQKTYFSILMILK